MEAWLGPSPSDLLMFDPATYYRLHELHNTALWPAHLIALAAGLALPFLLRARGSRAARPAAALLAAAWAGVAWWFLHQRYATINLAAPWFALGFALQALLLLGVAAGWIPA